MTQNNQALMLTLGHNSSAIYFDGEDAIGYETERIDRVKSSSSSPIAAIKQIERFKKIPNSINVFVSHWFDSWNNIPECKYFTDVKEFCKSKNLQICTNSEMFTHHDGHAWSVKSFYRHYGNPLNVDEQWIIVADGFGNFQETVSLYKTFAGTHGIRLEHRSYGYHTSLGLMYQYATDFVGMKMNQDEYKFLGYESMFGVYFNENQLDQIRTIASEKSVEMFANFLKENKIYARTQGHLISIQDLDDVRREWHQHFQTILEFFKIEDKHSEIARVIIANLIQTIIEEFFVLVIKHFEMKNVLLAGGCFYNVKLNNRILEEIEGEFCVVPLAGDQGAAIGFYEKYDGFFNWETLAIGKREMSDSLIYDIIKSVKSVWTPKTSEECIDLVSYLIKKDQIVNLVRSDMEFGPRALGHTSSLFLPTKENADYNNFINNRNEVMPFAPMIHQVEANVYFGEEQKRVAGSDEFMILTYKYLKEISKDNAGVYHSDPYKKDIYTGRPQIVKGMGFLPSLLQTLDTKNNIPLIANTSYNYHGEPIVFSLKDVLKTHYNQLSRAKNSRIDKKINLVIYKD